MLFIYVSVLGIYVGACKVTFSVSVWPDVYMYCVYEYVHLDQKYMLNLVSGGTWVNRAKATLHLLGYQVRQLLILSN